MGMSNLDLNVVPIGVMARRLGVPCQFLRDQADTGAIPCVRSSGVYLFNPAVVTQVLAERAGVERAAEKPRGEEEGDR